MVFSDKLKKLREENKLTQADLAKQLGVTQRTISYYETGKGIPSDPDMLNSLARIFNVSLDYLLLDDDQPDSKFHSLVKKLLKDTDNKRLKWVPFSCASYYKTASPYGEDIYEQYNTRFKIEDYINQNYVSIDFSRSFFAEYKGGGYLVAHINNTSDDITYALFAYYKDVFHFIADISSIKQIEELYFSITNTQSEIYEFIDEYLDDDEDKLFASKTFPDEEIPF